MSVAQVQSVLRVANARGVKARSRRYVASDAVIAHDGVGDEAVREFAVAVAALRSSGFQVYVEDHGLGAIVASE